MRKFRPVLIAGPTASGKSALAMAVAERLGGTIINADSMQVYQELTLLTARPSANDMGRVPHLLFGHVPASERYSVGRWLADVEPALDKVRRADRIPVLVGGTGLYFRVLTQGLADIPDVPAAITAQWQDRVAEKGAEAVHAVLAEQSAEEAARIPPTDAARLVRALSVLEATGCPLGDWHKAAEQQALVPLAEAEAVVVSLPRQDLYRRIEARMDRMVVEGAVDEAKALAELKLDPELPAMKAIGVPEFIAVARGEMPLVQAVTDAKTATRRYAKRQDTWFRHQAADWPRLTPDEFTGWLERLSSRR